MTARTHRTRGRALLMAAAGCLIAMPSAGVLAQDGGDFFQRLFGVAPRPVEAVAPSAGPGASPYRSRRRAAVRRPRSRYAALGQGEPLSLRITDRQAPLDMKAGPVAALMKDETLRPGDIVILKTGARVFTGEREKTHDLADFEPVDRSSLVSRKTRALLAAMIAPRGALPVDEARRLAASLKRIGPKPAADAPVAAEARAMRVINPWNAAEAR